MAVKWPFVIQYIIRINIDKFLIILGHFAGMPMVADGRGVGVKKWENLLTS